MLGFRSRGGNSPFFPFCFGGAPRPAQTHKLGPCKFHLRPLNFWKVESEAGAFRVVLQPLKIDSARGAAEHPNIAKPPS